MNEIYQLLAEMKIEYWRLINIEPIGRSKEQTDLLLEEKNYKYLLEFISNKRLEMENQVNITYGCSHYLTTEYEREVRDYFFLCGAVIYVTSIM